MTHTETTIVVMKRDEMEPDVYLTVALDRGCRWTTDIRMAIGFLRHSFAAAFAKDYGLSEDEFRTVERSYDVPSPYPEPISLCSTIGPIEIRSSSDEFARCCDPEFLITNEPYLAGAVPTKGYPLRGV